MHPMEKLKNISKNTLKEDWIMKKTRRITAILLSFILLISMSTTAFAKTYTGKNWYKQVLNKQSGTYRVKTINQYGKEAGYKTKKRSSYKYYKVVDINKDGTNELLLSTSKNGTFYGNSVLVLTYYKKKVKPLYCFEEMRKNAEIKGTKLNICHYGSDFANSRSYTLKNGQLKVSSRLDYYRNSQTGYAYRYYKNGKKISYNAYKKAVKSFWTGKKITFTKIN